MVTLIGRVTRWVSASVLGVALVIGLTFTPLTDALGLPGGILVVLAAPFFVAMFPAAKAWLVPGALGAILFTVVFVVAWNLSWS